MKEEVNKLGLIAEEQKVMDALSDAHRAYIELEVQHPDELQEFVYAVHLIQGLLAIRATRRQYPDGWPKK